MKKVLVLPLIVLPIYASSLNSLVNYALVHSNVVKQAKLDEKISSLQVKSKKLENWY